MDEGPPVRRLNQAWEFQGRLLRGGRLQSHRAGFDSMIYATKQSQNLPSRAHLTPPRWLSRGISPGRCWSTTAIYEWPRNVMRWKKLSGALITLPEPLQNPASATLQ